MVSLQRETVPTPPIEEVRFRSIWFDLLLESTMTALLSHRWGKSHIVLKFSKLLFRNLLAALSDFSVELTLYCSVWAWFVLASSNQCSSSSLSRDTCSHILIWFSNCIMIWRWPSSPHLCWFETCQYRCHFRVPATCQSNSIPLFCPVLRSHSDTRVRH